MNNNNDNYKEYITQHSNAYNELKLMEINGRRINLVEIWEHSWDEMVKEDEEIGIFLDSYEEISPLIPRDAFFGGRTETFDTNRQIQDDEKIKYIDVTSLYPYGMKIEPFPIGHPIKITKNFKPLDQYFGLVKLKILAPRGLRMPLVKQA